MPNLKVDLSIGSKIQLNGVEMLNDVLQFPRPPSTVPLQWTLSDNTIAEFLEANADRTQIQVKGLKVGLTTVTLTDGLLPVSVLDINVIAVPVVTPVAARIQILPLPVASGDPFGE